MSADVTIFTATNLIFLDAVATAGIVVWILSHRSRPEWVRWAVTVAVMVLLSVILAMLAAALYNDPRPFTTDHVRPLIAHAPDNGFPSDHGLLAAALVAMVALLEWRWAIPFVLLGFLVDWARVGAGIHHVTDVVGSAGLVAVSLVAALAIAPVLIRLSAPILPSSWVVEEGTRPG